MLCLVNTMKTELIKPLVWEIQHSMFSWGDLTPTRCLRPTAAAQSIHASCGCAAVFALPKAAVPGSPWMVHLMHSGLVKVLLLQFREEGGNGYEGNLPVLWLGELCARELNKPGEGTKVER